MAAAMVEGDGQRRTKKKKLAAGEPSVEVSRWPLVKPKPDLQVARLKGDHLFTVRTASLVSSSVRSPPRSFRGTGRGRRRSVDQRIVKIRFALAFLVIQRRNSFAAKDIASALKLDIMRIYRGNGLLSGIRRSERNYASVWPPILCH